MKSYYVVGTIVSVINSYFYFCILELSNDRMNAKYSLIFIIS